MMRLPELEILAEISLSRDERCALVALMSLGVSDAATLCREGDIPSSKIYRAMEKLAELGLVQSQPTRPKQYAALPADTVVDRMVDIARERAERFARGTQELRRMLAALPERLRGRQTFVDLALGMESHVRRHLVHLATATTRILSYMERGDLAAIDKAVASGFPLLRRIARNAGERRIQHRVVFGFSYQTAPLLVEFLRRHRAEIRHITGVRYSGELGHPFHVVDEETVVLPLDHPFVPEGRFASLLVRDRDLAGSLTDGFEKLWRKAMRDLGEINFQPIPHSH
jgi:HTH-type transcriptional regulator, sugar sensing transcriptional regulator